MRQMWRPGRTERVAGVLLASRELAKEARLSDPGLAAYESRRARNDPPTEDSVQFGYTGRHVLGAVDPYVRQQDGRGGRPRRATRSRPRVGRTADLLDLLEEGIPLPATGTASRPSR